jgi:hypothetical protein
LQFGIQLGRLGNAETAENIGLAELRFPRGRFTRDVLRRLASLYHHTLEETLLACIFYRRCIAENPRNIDVHASFALLLTRSVKLHREAEQVHRPYRHHLIV